MDIEAARLESSLWMETLSELMDLDSSTMCLDWSVDVALMKSSLHSTFLSMEELSSESLSETAEAIFDATLSVSLCRIRKPTALIVTVFVSFVLLSRDTVKRMLSRVVAEKLSLIVIRALCSRKAIASFTFLTGPELAMRRANSSALGRLVSRVLATNQW